MKSERVLNIHSREPRIEDLEMKSLEAAKRTSVTMGDKYVLDLNRAIPIPELIDYKSNNIYSYETSPVYQPQDLRIGNNIPMNQISSIGLIIRNSIEWAIWSRQTAFPHVRDSAFPGEPLGQCLVTSRLAKNYFLDSKLTEVSVQKNGGEVVGPHVVLEIQNYCKGEEGKYYLDLTPDQSLAVGYLPQFARDLDQWCKVNIRRTNDPSSPYIFKRYQDDQELAGKKSKPLSHFSLLMELLSFRTADTYICQGIERYAKKIRLQEFENTRENNYYDLSDNNLDREIIISPTIKSKIENAIQYLSQHKGQRLEIGLIEDQEFKPNVSWLWEVSGLKGFDSAYAYDNGLLHEMFFYDNNQIIVVNLEGDYTIDSIAKIGEIFLEENKLRPLYNPSLLEKYIKQRHWDGPIFVHEK